MAPSLKIKVRWEVTVLSCALYIYLTIKTTRIVFEGGAWLRGTAECLRGQRSPLISAQSWRRLERAEWRAPGPRGSSWSPGSGAWPGWRAGCRWPATTASLGGNGGTGWRGGCSGRPETARVRSLLIPERRMTQFPYTAFVFSLDDKTMCKFAFTIYTYVYCYCFLFWR